MKIIDHVHSVQYTVRVEIWIGNMFSIDTDGKKRVLLVFFWVLFPILQDPFTITSQYFSFMVGWIESRSFNTAIYGKFLS